MFPTFFKSVRQKVVTKKHFHTEVAVPENIEFLRGQLSDNIKKLLGRSLHIREVDPGSSNAEEVEVNMLANPYYDMERYGIHVSASPRHADVLLVSGPVSINMIEPLKRAYNAMPEPKMVVAIGDNAKDGGIFKGSYGIAGGVPDVIPVDIFVPGNPPTPTDLLAGLLGAVDRLETKIKKTL